ncbi:MAG: hypothetical protein MW690_001442 [Methanophagales archaeon]|nr:hypothetical protein [Methanophagales archaeon]MCU4139510.1 hypothetical protein [Methanophagales archaeon]
MFRIWRREGSGSSGGSRREDEGEQGEERGMMEEVMREGVDEESGEIDASLSSPVKGDPFSASEDEIRAIEDWWSQKEEEGEEEESEKEKVVSGEEGEGDSSTDELLSRLKEIGSEEEEEESLLMHEMEELGNLSVEDLLLLAKEIREDIERIKEERKITDVKGSESVGDRNEVSEEEL